MSTFKLPDLGEGLADAKILQWHVKELDHIKIDEPLLSVETAKSVIEIPSPESGIIKKMYGAVGDNIQVDADLVMFEEQTAKNIKAMPAARKLANKHNINLQNIQPENNVTITVADVEKLISNNANSNRKAMSYNMQHAYRSVVPATIHEDINLRLWGEATDITSRVLQSMAYALLKMPIINSTFCDTKNELIPCESINIGLAVQKESGLYIPNIYVPTDNGDIEQIRAQINTIKTTEVIKPNKINHSIMYSNIGSIAGQYTNPILVPPAIMIVATGKIRKKVAELSNKPAICPIMPISVTFDHRAITGAEAATFIKYFEQDLMLPASQMSSRAYSEV